MGRVGTLQQYDLAGRPVPSLHWHSHAVTVVAPDEFLLFDNNIHNRGPGGDGGSRLLRIRVVAAEGSAREVWRWPAPRTWQSLHHGDADVVPLGNIVGTFPGNNRIIEVCMCVCVRMSVCVCVRARARACVRVCVCERVVKPVTSPLFSFRAGV